MSLSAFWCLNVLNGFEIRTEPDQSCRNIQVRLHHSLSPRALIQNHTHTSTTGCSSTQSYLQVNSYRFYEQISTVTLTQQRQFSSVCVCVCVCLCVCVCGGRWCSRPSVWRAGLLAPSSCVSWGLCNWSRVQRLHTTAAAQRELRFLLTETLSI